MAINRRTITIDALLRVAGLTLAGIGYAAIRAIVADYHRHPAGYPSALDLILGMISFPCLGAAAALLVRGHHIFDEVPISERWARRPADG